MRVIAGKVGKSKVLIEQMNILNKKEIMVIDSVGVPAVTEKGNYFVKAESMENVIEIFLEIEQQEETSKEIKYIVLSLNAPIEYLELLLNWEKRLGKRFIVTIQDNTLDRVMMFDSSLPA